MSEVHLLGGEMLGWSDLDGAHGPGPVRGPGLAALLSVASGRTLVVGPHDPQLLDALPSADLTVLVRGLPDAESLADRYADRSGVRVCCGGPEKLAGTAPYDTVVALDGLERLDSVEGTQLTWGEAFDLLVSVLRPGGRLLLGAENPLGLHRLLAAPPPSTDSDWAALGEYDDTRPAGPARLRARLTASGLRIGGVWAVFPSPIAPAALLDTELLADPDLTGFLQAVLGDPAVLGNQAVPGDRAVHGDGGGRTGDPGTGRDGPVPAAPLLADPARLAGSAVRNGIAGELAPAWVLLGERLPDPLTLTDQTVAARAHLADDRTKTVPPAALLMREGRLREVRRDPAGGWRFADGEAVPSGRTVEDLVVAATLRRDLPAVRALLTTWQSGAMAGTPADAVVVTPAGTWHGLSGATEPMFVLRRLASRLIDAGLADLWPAGELAAMLTTTAGRKPGSSVDDVSGAAAGGWRELLVDRDRLTRELSEARALQDWYERTLTERDDEMKRLRRIVALLHGTPTARAGRLLLAGARTARRTARSAVRRLRPTD
ncbi:hypothetical protein ENC19_19535 [Verrucosispora sp. CWR15]|uniref:Class I SAM-dependent methyltransferase n=2 Tax=Verrucosispora sioxanthis TaxID=2499994 RepID=A0A6M1L901_9ACTN|nr:hypothetical protein [Verrucosispora sioxanthis]NEE65581.1 hypothetical protein [Verrucosispora sioxanthis]NGM14691.1 hypothetical protein [Verrucosispora sioxanthis]